jgi:hypothetical protein
VTRSPVSQPRLRSAVKAATSATGPKNQMTLPAPTTSLADPQVSAGAGVHPVVVD